jgi:hypothetical protein
MADYYFPAKEDLYVGMPIERHIDKYGVQLISSRYDEYCLMGRGELQECGEHLLKHFIYEPSEVTQEDIDSYGQEVGTLRLKKKKK